MKKQKLFTLAVAICFSCVVFGQAVPPPVPPPPPPGLPIDGGIFLLFVASLIYGIKKIRD